jgi:hypothetical protein
VRNEEASCSRALLRIQKRGGCKRELARFQTLNRPLDGAGGAGRKRGAPVFAGSASLRNVRRVVRNEEASCSRALSPQHSEGRGRL